MIDCPAEPTLIENALVRARQLNLTGVENPYGDGNASIRIRQVLEDAPNRQRLLEKTTTLLG